MAARPAADEPELRGLVRAPPSPPPARPARAPHCRAPGSPRLDATDAAAPLDEPTARALAADFTAYLAAARAAGLSSVAPGRFLMPGDLEGSPALTFSPLHRPDAPPPATRSGAPSSSRFEAYKRVVVGAVLPQPLRPPRPPGGADRRARRHPRRPARRRGPARRHGRDPRLLPPRRRARGSRRSSAAASTASSSPPPRPTTCTTASTASSPPSPRRWSATPAPAPQFTGADTRALSIASLRATVEQTVTRDGREIDVVRGRARSTPARRPRSSPATCPTTRPRILAPGPPGRRRLDRRRLPRHPLRPAAAALAAGERPAAHPPRPRRRVPDRRPPA